MKRFLTLFILAIVAATACSKKEQKSCNTSFIITGASTIPVTTAAAGIPVVVNSYGADLCSHYTGLSVSQQSSPSGPVYAFEYFVSATGTRDCGDEVVCAQALVNASDSITIRPTMPGTYKVHFRNITGTFRTDTVIVN